MKLSIILLIGEMFGSKTDLRLDDLSFADDILAELEDLPELPDFIVPLNTDQLVEEMMDFEPTFVWSTFRDGEQVRAKSVANWAKPVKSTTKAAKSSKPMVAKSPKLPKPKNQHIGVIEQP